MLNLNCIYTLINSCFMVSDDETLLKTIVEVAKELNIQPYVIRYWETQFLQIHPIRKNGKRLYSRDNIEIIKKIKELLYDNGYTIKGAQNYLVGETVQYQDSIKDILDNLKNLREFLSRFIQ